MALRPLVVLFGVSLTVAAQSGRGLQMTVPPALGEKAQFVLNYPAGAVGAFCWYALSPRFVGTQAIATSGFAVSGAARIDVSNFFTSNPVWLGPGTQDTWCLPVPNRGALLGFAFDVQTIDVDFAGGAIAFGDNDVETEVGAGAVGFGRGMVAVPAATFSMGSAASSGPPYYGQPNERPLHPVQHPLPFWIGRHEVTQGEFAAVMLRNPSFHQPAGDPQNAQRPVDSVTWSEAVAYCAAVDAIERAAGRVPEGYQYRLPTESEWEQCCRAGTTSEYATGASIACADANIAGCLGRTQPVGIYAANAYGLHDMHGNVAEWTLDGWDVTANYSAAAVTMPYQIPGLARAVRGGSYLDSFACRSAFRTPGFPAMRAPSTGFRLALAPVVGAGLALLQLQATTYSVGTAANIGAIYSPQTNERPQHQVRLNRPLWVSAHETTQAQWAEVMGNNPSVHAGTANSPQLPVENVSWRSAMAFCRALTQRERTAGRLPFGYEYRLPTEAEWEIACRASSNDAFAFGADLGCVDANFANDLQSGAACGSAMPRIVGYHRPSLLSLHDMHGNVREWCFDSWDGVTANYTAAMRYEPSSQNGALRCVRGGSFAQPEAMCRSAYRGAELPDFASGDLGFRVVLAPHVGMPDELGLVGVPAGTFTMGTNATGFPVYAGAVETPAHPVTITRTYWMGRYEVTQSLYLSVMGSNPSIHQGAAYPLAATQPVENVPFADAEAFCAALNQRELAAGRLPSGLVYRLPSEAEWERAARGGSTTQYWLGDVVSCGQGHMATIGNRLCPIQHQQPAPVGSYAPNPFGLFDMIGNVCEWCSDAWDGFAGHGSTAPRVDPVSTVGIYRVIRDTNFLGDGWWARCSARLWGAPNLTGGSGLGFRIVLGAPL